MDMPVKLDIKIDVKADLTKPICKLIDAVSRGCHSLVSPSLIRRQAKAEAFAAITHAQAIIDTAIIKAEGSQQLQDIEFRAAQRILQQSVFNQANIESVIEKTISQLPEVASEALIETDWLVAFFDNVKNISNDNMQEIWAKILTGEISQPGSCSMRTLNILKQMSQKEAILFSEFCSFLVVIENQINPSFFTDTYGSHGNRFVKREFNQQERLLLAEMGLVNFEEDIFFNFKLEQAFNITYGSKRIAVKYCGEENRNNEIKTIICGYPLTQSGKELFAICKPAFVEEYWINLKMTLKALRFEVNELGRG